MIAPYGFNQVPTTDGTPAEQQTARPDVGEQTGPQNTLADYPGFWGWNTANGGCESNPCGFPGYGQRYLGTYSVYRQMRRHPVIALARAQVFDAILSGKGSYTVRKGTPKEVEAFIKEKVEPIRGKAFRSALTALDFGWAGFEKIWKVDGGKLLVEKLKLQLVDHTQILGDKGGNFAGLKCPKIGGGQVELGVHESWLYTYNEDAQPLYGEPRLENFRATAWRDWQDAATDLFRLTNKISGIMPVIYTPTGDVLVAGGVTKNWRDIGNEVLRNAKKGVGIHLYHMGALGAGGRLAAGQANFEQLIELIKNAAVRLEVIDFGDNAPAIGGILDRMRHNEELMVEGYLRSIRTAMDSKNSSKADSQQHTDTADKGDENLSLDVADSFNKSVIDDHLIFNWGEEMRGAVAYVPAKLSDENQAMDTMALTALFQSPDLGAQAMGEIDWRPIFERRNLQTKGEGALYFDALDATGAEDLVPEDVTP